MAVSVSAIESELFNEISSVNSCPLVAVLLCTYNGSRFLTEQLESISEQKGTNINLWVSDDGSDIETHNILKQYQTVWDGYYSILKGPRKGFAANFISLTCSSRIRADYIAYADQDDVWEEDKLSRAIEKLQSVPEDIPALYCSRTRLIDKNGLDIGFSQLFDKPPSFANALVQNIGGGNTMVMNRAAHKLLRRAGRRFVVYHDWWVYMLVSGAGGLVFYDPYPSVRYRQHENNQLGGDTSLKARIFRIKLLLRGRFRDWNAINSKALQEVKHLLTANNRRILDDFCMARKRSLVPRLWGIYKSGIYRQTFIGNLGLFVATLLNKI